jgi:hypothetical protein
MPGRPRLHPRHRRRDRLNIGAGWGQAVRGFYAVKYIYTTLYDLYVAPPPPSPVSRSRSVPRRLALLIRS